MAMTSTEFSRLVAERAIEATGVTQTELARWAGVDGSHLSKVLRGERGLTSESMQLLAENAGIPLPRLVMEAQLSDESLPPEYIRFLEKAISLFDGFKEDPAH